jgi:hypothetical protein
MLEGYYYVVDGEIIRGHSNSLVQGTFNGSPVHTFAYQKRNDVGHPNYVEYFLFINAGTPIFLHYNNATSYPISLTFY